MLDEALLLLLQEFDVVRKVADAHAGLYLHLPPTAAVAERVMTPAVDGGLEAMVADYGVVVMAATPSSAAGPPSTARIIIRSATTPRRREAEVETRTCVSDLARYIEFLREEEEECLVEHAKSLTAAVAAAHADAEARN